MNYKIASYNETLEKEPEFVKQVITSGQSPEATLQALDAMEIENYVTKGGDLIIKTWIMGKEKFVSTEKAAVIGENRQEPKQGRELDWLSENLQSIREQYSDQWIAVHSDKVVAAAPSLPDLTEQISGFYKPLVTFISSKPVAGTFTYANKTL